MNVMNLLTAFPLLIKSDFLTNKVYKTLVTVGKKRWTLCLVIPIAAELDLKKAAKAVGEKSVEMLHVKEITKVTGYVRGGCTAIGMKKQFPTVIDESACTQKLIYVSGGKIGMQIRLKPDDLQKRLPMQSMQPSLSDGNF